MRLDRLLDWIAEPDAGPRARRAALIALAVLAALELLLHGKAYFDIQKTPGFSAVFGVLACGGLVLAAGVIADALRREDEDD